MSDLSYVIPLGSLIISITTLLMTYLSMKSKANGNYVETIEMRVNRLEEQLSECNKECKRLIIENIELVRRLAHLN